MHPLQSARSPNSVDPSRVEDQWSAVINTHGATRKQIEAAVIANAHPLDPHPTIRGRMVRRHPVYLVAQDYSVLDARGRPKPGAPADDLDLGELRRMYSQRYAYVSPDAPPSDSSHIHVKGSRFVAEMDQQGQPTGRVILQEGVN
jgi:hypothetical protein